jgi:hypothetical protein
MPARKPARKPVTSPPAPRYRAPRHYRTPTGRTLYALLDRMGLPAEALYDDMVKEIRRGFVLIPVNAGRAETLALMTAASALAASMSAENLSYFVRLMRGKGTPAATIARRLDVHISTVKKILAQKPETTIPRPCPEIAIAEATPEETAVFFRKLRRITSPAAIQKVLNRHN